MRHRLKIFITLLLICFFFTGCFSVPKPPELPAIDPELKAYDKDGNEIKGLSKIPNTPANSDSNGTTAGQAWWFYILTGVLLLVAIGAFYCKEMTLSISCGIGAVAMAIMPSLIEAIHAALQGLVWFFYGALILGFLALVAFVGMRIYKYVPKAKTEEDNKVGSK